jgi:glycerol-1-phosphate dehydrogenase [NAD(P)+]
MEYDIYKNHTFVCECGKIHSMPIEEIYIEENALDRIKDAPIRLNLGRNVMVVSDSVIMGLVGDTILKKLEDAACKVNTLLFDVPIVPDEKRITKFLLEMPPDIDFFLAVGSGAVNDITRFFSYKLKIPYISIPTAPSMDGYSAKVSLLFINGIKRTFNAQYPCAIYADIELLKNAPRTLILAGLGDLIAKITACADWRISNIINGEYFCNYTYNTVMDTLKKCMDSAVQSNMATSDSIKTLMEGLLTSGIAMHWVNTSRPAAGAEHHITHFWGMQKEAQQRMHGIECAVGTVVMLQIYKQLLQIDFQAIDENKVACGVPTREEWDVEIRNTFGDNYSFIIDQQRNKEFDTAKIRQRIIKIIFETLQYAEGLEETLKFLKIPTKPSDLSIDMDMFKASLKWSKEVRNKYTVLDLAYDIGVLDQIMESIL